MARDKHKSPVEVTYRKQFEPVHLALGSPAQPFYCMAVTSNLLRLTVNWNYISQVVGGWGRVAACSIGSSIPMLGHTVFVYKHGNRNVHIYKGGRLCKEIDFG